MATRHLRLRMSSKFASVVSGFGEIEVKVFLRDDLGDDGFFVAFFSCWHLGLSQQFVQIKVDTGGLEVKFLTERCPAIPNVFCLVTDHRFSYRSNGDNHGPGNVLRFREESLSRFRNAWTHRASSRATDCRFQAFSHSFQGGHLVGGCFGGQV